VAAAQRGGVRALQPAQGRMNSAKGRLGLPEISG